MTDVSKAFSSLNLQSPLLKNLETLGFAEMTDIQAKSLPLILAGKDVLGKAILHRDYIVCLPNSVLQEYSF